MSDSSDNVMHRSDSPGDERETADPPQAFPPTRWSRVRQCAAGEAEGTARQALERLCCDYWYPLYAFARRRGARQEDAQDLVQGFFVHVIKTGLFGKADPQAGRLRSFLLKSFTNFCAADYARSQRTRRHPEGGWLVMDWEEAERSLDKLAGHEASPEEFYDRNWALEMLQRTLGALEAEYAESGRSALFAALRPFLSLHPPDGAAAAQAEVELGLSPGALRQAVHRIRNRFGSALRSRIADTLEHPSDADVDLEMEALRRAVTVK